MIQAECGLPMFMPNDTTGFDVEIIDYDDDDLVLNTAMPPRLL